MNRKAYLLQKSKNRSVFIRQKQIRKIHKCNICCITKFFLTDFRQCTYRGLAIIVFKRKTVFDHFDELSNVAISDLIECNLFAI